MKINISLFVIFCLFFFRSVATETTIEGHLSGGENLEIRLVTYADQITYAEQILDRTEIDSSGSFSLSADLKKTVIAFLDIEFFSSVIYLIPGEHYVLEWDSVSISDQFRPFYNKEQLPFRIISGDSLNLNSLISDFNYSYNYFILSHFEEIYKRHKKSLINDFSNQTARKYDSVTNDYFRNYITYKIASVDLAASSVAKQILFKKYVQNKPVLYENIEYMNFFNQFFLHYLTSGTRSIKRADLEAAINEDADFSALMDTLGKDTLLMNEVIRELVMLKGLRELYGNPDFVSKNILHILDQVEKTSKFPEHRIIAADIKEILTKLAKGTMAPDFTLLSLSGDTVTLSQLRGKPVYLSFMTTWSYACLAEFDLMDKLYTEYKGKIVFLTVSLDKDINTIIRYKKEKGFDWTFLYNGTSYDLLKTYQVSTFPVFVLIGANGKILQYPAYKPSERIEDSFNSLLNPEK